MAGLPGDVEVLALLLMQAFEVAVSHRADQVTGLEKRAKKRTKSSAEKGEKEGELLQISRMDGALRRQQAPIRSEVSVGGKRVRVDSLEESQDKNSYHETANGKFSPSMYEYLSSLHSADCLNFPAIAFLRCSTFP